MARKRKTLKHRTVRRHRRVSGIIPDKDELMSVAGVVAGLVASSYASKLLPSTLDGKIKSAILLAGGFILMKQRNPLIAGAAKGLAAVGTFQLVNALKPGTLPAIGNAPSIMFDNPALISGFNSYPNNPQRNTIAGFNNFPNNPQLNTIAGIRSGAMSAGSGL